MVLTAMATSSSVAVSISVPRSFVAGGGGSSCCSNLVFSPLCSSFSGSEDFQTRRRARARTGCKKVNCVSFEGLRRAKSRSCNMFITSSRGGFRKRGLGRVYASVEEGVKSSSETDSSEEIRPPASSNDSSQEQAESLPASPPNPFVGGKISSRIAAKKVGNSQQQQPASPVAAMPRKAPSKKSAVSSNRPSASGQLSASAASQLKVARSPNVFTVPSKPAEKGNAGSPPTVSPGELKPVSPVPQPGASKLSSPPNPFRRTPFIPTDWEKAGARAPGAGKRVLDAFKESAGDGTPMAGQPLPPKNIFDEVRRTPEEIAADAFKFEFNPGQLLLVSSFLVIIGVMFGTVLLVWKAGGIHYNEY